MENPSSHFGMFIIDDAVAYSIREILKKLEKKLFNIGPPTTINSTADGSTVGIFWKDPYFSIQIDDKGPYTVTDYFTFGNQNFAFFEDEEPFLDYLVERSNEVFRIMK